MIERPWLRHYDYWVPHHLSYPERPLYEILDSAVVDVPDRPATSFLGATLTFAEIKQRSDLLAAALERFAIANLRRGGIVVNINPTYTARELLGVAVDSGITLLITLDALAPLALGIQT